METLVKCVTKMSRFGYERTRSMKVVQTKDEQIEDLKSLLSLDFS
jgi:hypothetical protein